jgi:hypothetical protein
MFERLWSAYQRWRVRRRRKKILYAYAKIGRIRHGLGPGFTPLLFAYGQVTNEGLAVYADGELVWIWPEGELDLTEQQVKAEVDDRSDGLVCMFCEADGFESAEELEQHLDGHPDLGRREADDAD